MKMEMTPENFKSLLKACKSDIIQKLIEKGLGQKETVIEIMTVMLEMNDAFWNLHFTSVEDADDVNVQFFVEEAIAKWEITTDNGKIRARERMDERIAMNRNRDRQLWANR